MSIQLKSKFLQDYFYSDDVPFDIFVAAYRSAVRVLNSPDLYPNSDLEFYEQLEQELILESPTHCGYCR